MICEMWNVKSGHVQNTQLCRGADLRSATLIKKRLWYRCFPVNFVNFLRTPFLHNTCGGCFWKHNVTMKTTAKFASNSSASIKLSKHLSVFSLDFKEVLYEEQNVAAKKLCGGVVALKLLRKLTCNSWFCNVVGCKTLISIVLGCSPGKCTWKV